MMALCLQNRPSPGSIPIPTDGHTLGHSTGSSHLTPSLTAVWSTIMSSSDHTSNTTSKQYPPPPKVCIRPSSNQDINNNYMDIVMNNDGQLFMQDEYVISDRDEMEGDEHEDAVKSPLKGVGVCVHNDVSFY